MGGSLTPAEVATFANGLKTFSLDPALTLLVSGIADRIVLCCSVSPSVGGIIGNQVRRLTLDPGARRLAGVLDAVAR